MSRPVRGSRESWGIKILYFDWLYNQVFEVRGMGSPNSYTVVCNHLHSVQFNDRVPNDDNRSAEGEELRDEFISTLKGIDIEDYTELYSLGKCTLFEMLIALARRADYIAEKGTGIWFRTFLSNLGLICYNDASFIPADGARITAILRKFNERRYTRSGKGGLFPLREAREDQRSAEIWHQMSDYMTENRMY
jgi:hypothetical protein